MTEKQIARRKKFLAIGQLSHNERHLGHEADRHYFGGEQQFDIKCSPVQDRELNSHFASAPQTKTQQWERTLRA